MRFIKKSLWVILCVVIFIVVFLTSSVTKGIGIFGESIGYDFSLSGESDVKPLSEDEFTKEMMAVKYIKEDNTVDTRNMILYRPTFGEGDIPVIYIPHYAAEENSSDFVSYIRHGWAVASPEFESSYNGTLVADDLVFNNAALYTLRHMDGIDHQRIAIVGGSAGGYMSLMLNGLQMGTTAAIATAPIANAYFNCHEYFPACDEVNRSSGLFSIAMPIQLLVSKSFQPANEILGEDISRWEAVSPISLASSYSNPVVMAHNTSDILVPVDQITHQYTYEKNDGTLPEGFDCHLGTDYPGILSKTFEEMADPDELTIYYSKFEDMHVTGELPYADTLITININDDGAPTAKGSHANPAMTGSYDIFPYLEEMLDRTLAGTEELVPDKLLLLLERYQGNSIALPAHEGVDDTVYGSLAVYQQEVIDELGTWVDNHSEEEMDTAIRDAIAMLDEEEQRAYTEAWEEILAKRQ